MRAILIPIVAVIAFAGCDASRTPTPRAAGTPNAAPRATSDNAARVVIERALPDGPLFVEGSAAYALLREERSGVRVLSGFFDVPRFRDTDEAWPRRLRGLVRAGRYELRGYQRPCDPSACMDSTPQDWDPPTARCRHRLLIAPAHVVMVTLVVTEDDCRVRTTSYLRGETG